MSSRTKLVTIAALLFAGAAVASAVMLTPNSRFTASGCSPPHIYDGGAVNLVIVADHSGFNGSVAHGSPKNPWPCIGVKKGSTVNIEVQNRDSVETHGFAIGHYFDGGVALSPGGSYRLSFVANQDGSFTIFCTVFCTIHVYMVGQLVVVD